MKRTLAALVVAAPWALCSPQPSAGADEPAFDPGAAMRAAVRVLEQGHIERKRLDDTLSARWLSEFLDRLDPKRMYFHERDAGEFRRFEAQLDDLAKRGDFGFPQAVRERYRQRVAEAALPAEEFLAAEHDFSLDEAYPLEFPGYAATSEELYERWRLRIKAELLIERRHGTDGTEAVEWLRARYRRIARQADEMTDERLCQIYLDSLATLYDPHCSYNSPTFLEWFDSTIRIRTYRLGLHVRQRAGELAIAYMPMGSYASPLSFGLIGWNLMAIRRIDGTILDLVEMHLEDYLTVVISPTGPLGTDAEVILELVQPTTGERMSLTRDRVLSSSGSATR
jgi:carboxyl-terminal processing protease